MIFYQLSINSIQYYLKIIKRTLEFVKLNKMAVKFFWKKNMRKPKQNKTHLKQNQKQSPQIVEDGLYNEQQRTEREKP